MERLEAHPAPVRMISGHVHRAMTGQIGRVTCQIAPATCHAVLTDHQPETDPQLVLEPGGFTVCRWLDAPETFALLPFIQGAAKVGSGIGPHKHLQPHH